MYWAYIANKFVNNYDHGKITWQIELGREWSKTEWEQIRKHAFHISISTKLRIFQYKVLSKKIMTNSMRNKWDSSVSPKCQFCQKITESMIHIFCECEKVQSFWKAVVKWVKYVCGIDMVLTNSLIIINKNSGKDKAFLDTILLIAKQYIYATKCLKENLNVNKMLNKVHDMYIIEKEVALQRSAKKRFNEKWKKYEDNVVLSA